MSKHEIDDTIYSYATLRQKEIIDAIREHGNQRKAAKALNVSRGTVSNAIAGARAKAAKQGYSPQHGMTHTVPDGFMLKGTSTLYDADGTKKIEWVKSTVDQERQAEMIQAFVNELCKDVKPVKPQTLPKIIDTDYMTVYPFGDPHIGLHAWGEEAGEDYDLKIAEQVFTQAMQIAVDKSPPSAECLIVNVGDFFHSDNSSNKTERSGNNLDVDSRYTKIARVGVRIIQAWIAAALAKHKTVRMINAKGNHDPHSSQWLAIALDARYAEEPRVIIEMNPSEYQYITFGKTLIGVTHGDRVKPADLESIMATDKAQDWGKTKHRYWYTGHVHHDQLKEYRGCKFESFRTLAAKDGWHAGAGYRSGRDLKVIVHHKEFGEVERYTIGVDQFSVDKGVA